MHMNRSRTPILLVISLLTSLTFCAPAYADSLAVKQAEAVQVERQVTTLNTKAEIASEQYNASRIRYNRVTDKVHATERQIAKIQKRTRFLQSHLVTRARDMYHQGPLGFLSVLLSVHSFEQFDTTIRVLTSLNDQDAAAVAQLKEAKAEAKAARATLVAAQTDAGRQRAAMASNEQTVRTQLAARKHLLAGLTADIQKLVAQRLASAAIPEQVRTMKVLLRQRTASTGGVVLGTTPASSPRAAAAVYYAEKEIGKPYVWAAAGPNTFDCSGLMLWAYGHAGVNLNHYSGDQIHQGAHVSRSDLRPGDLVFFGSPIHHVGMFVGGDAFIEAPYTGTDVRISRFSNRGDFAGACRP
jgi:peptidoglycan DL-endopeptidase CwlO